MIVSLVVPAYNEEELLPATLASILGASSAFHDAGWQTELIVCDNNSSDRTADVARASGARVVFEPINQIARARNAGAAAARGDWLVFVDADSHPSAELFGEVAAAIRGGRVVAGGATVRLDSSSRTARAVVTSWNRISRTMKWAAGSFIFCETRAFLAVGGFNIELYASEEIDLFRRFKRLAREEHRTITVLHRHPIRTSDRKIRLYSHQEHLKFLMKTIARGGRTLRSAKDCYTWYDGRR
jgi:glycosyltransferase involved in cell wall biosynthesis